MVKLEVLYTAAFLVFLWIAYIVTDRISKRVEKEHKSRGA